MRKYVIPILFVVSIFTFSPYTSPASADTYAIDKTHTSITYSVRHMVISNVKGRFEDFEGTIVYDKADVTKSSVNITIQVASQTTDDEDRDEHLATDEFFDTEKYPTMTFVSKRIETSDDGFIAHGDLTIRGVTKEVALPFVVNGPIIDPWGNTRIGAEASIKLDRRDYGMTGWTDTLKGGGLLVGNDIKIEIQLEAVVPKS